MEQTVSRIQSDNEQWNSLYLYRTDRQLEWSELQEQAKSNRQGEPKHLARSANPWSSNDASRPSTKPGHLSIIKRPAKFPYQTAPPKENAIQQQRIIRATENADDMLKEWFEPLFPLTIQDQRGLNHR